MIVCYSHPELEIKSSQVKHIAATNFMKYTEVQHIFIFRYICW